MPEAWGRIVVRIADTHPDIFNTSDEGLGWDQAMDLCRFAGVDPTKHRNFSIQIDQWQIFPFEDAPAELDGERKACRTSKESVPDLIFWTFAFAWVRKRRTMRPVRQVRH